MYIYQADVYCDTCGREIRNTLRKEANYPKYPDREDTYDSDEFPKPCDECESDSPDHCAAGETCLNAITLPSGRKVGLLMGELTRDGVEYVKEAAKARTEVTDLWQTHYRDNG